MTDQAVTPTAVVLADSAARRLAELSQSEGRPVMLRVAVDGGGCSGFQYRLELVEAAQADDVRVENAGQSALIDTVSLPFLEGSEIQFVDELLGAQFKIVNPNAVASCGCGVSFTI